MEQVAGTHHFQCRMDLCGVEKVALMPLNRCALGDATLGKRVHLKAGRYQPWQAIPADESRRA
jgi:hypothetical protein